MRKIDQLVKKCFFDVVEMKNGNTEIKVEIEEDCTLVRLYLHDNCIATMHVSNFGQRTLTVNCCGWATNVTVARLNAIVVGGIKRNGSMIVYDGRLYSATDDIKINL